MIILEGFMYVKQRSLKCGDDIYECMNRKNKGYCKAKLKINNDELLSKINQHSHAPDTDQCLAVKFQQDMKEKSVEMKHSSQQIFSEGCDDI